MSGRLPVFLEVASKRTFASAMDWPGWSRSGRTEQDALEAFVAYGPRYSRTLRRVTSDLDPPRDADDLDVVERLEGGSGTEFGVPSVAASTDDRPVTDDELRRLTTLLRAAWSGFDSAAATAVGVELRKGPRGGGRDLAKIVGHVLDAEGAYLSELGGSHEAPKGGDVAARMAAVRDAMVATLRASAHGDELRPMVRRTRPYWSVRYCVRRSAWHALDHAWEIEDRAAPEPEPG
jgi:hypothetical protein